MHIDVFILYLPCSVLLLRFWYLNYEPGADLPSSKYIYDIEGTTVINEGPVKAGTKNTPFIWPASRF